MVDGKARLVSDSYCDGLGACLGECPRGAITIEEREALPFDEAAVKVRVGGEGGGAAASAAHAAQPAAGGGCPGLRAFVIPPSGRAAPAPPADVGGAVPSELRQWPIQLHLVPVRAPYWDGAELLIAADCAAFSYGAFHCDLLRGKRLIIACPKLDDTSAYVEKLAAILGGNRIRSLTVVHMAVPCCTGIVRIAQAALAAAGRDIPFRDVTVTITGELVE